MKKFLVLLLLCFTCLVTACKQPCPNENPSQTPLPETLYNQFLSKEINAIDKNGNIITFESYMDSNSDTSSQQYAIFDMNGDHVPELILKTTKGLDIFWIENDKVALWYEGTNYTKPLNNMALLSERKGSAPDHIDYSYIILGYQGEEVLKIQFSKYSATEIQGVLYAEKYFINNTEVTQEIYNSLSSPLLNVGDNGIIWKVFY